MVGRGGKGARPGRLRGGRDTRGGTGGDRGKKNEKQGTCVDVIFF